MKRILGILAATLVLGVSLSGCPKGKIVELSVFHTNDIHSHMRAAKTDPFGLGGLARLSTLLTSLRATRANSITLDAGDWSEGTWYYSNDTGANMLRILSQMGFAAAALGNHDFLSGPDRLAATLKEANPSMAVLAANLDFSAYAGKDELSKRLPPYVIQQVGDVKVGLIGLTTYEFLYDSYIAPVKILDPVTTATKLAIELRPKVDILLVLSHNSFDVNKAIARVIPGIDGIISGHSHVKIPTAVMVMNAGRQIPVVETGQWGTFLGDLKFDVDVTNHFATLKSYELHPVTSDIAEDPSIAALVDAEDKKLDSKFNDDVHRVVARADVDIGRGDFAESLEGNLAVQAYRAATGADLAMEEISFTGVPIAQGDVSLMDLHDVVPHIYDKASDHEWTLKVWDAPASDLSVIINVFYTVSSLVPLSPLGWLTLDNAVVTWDPSRKSLPVKQIQIGGKELDPTRTYKVALHDGMLRGIQIANDKYHLGLDLSRLQETGIEAWQAITQYAEDLKELKVDDLRVGKRVHTTGPDLAIFDYSLAWDGNALGLTVENLGLALSNGGKLTCSSGLPDDLIAYGTDEQKWTVIGSADVGSLAPGGQVAVQIPWKPALDGKRWPIHCQVAGQSDAFSADDVAEKVFRAAR